MLFIWGKKSVVTVLGRVADFCPICRDVGAFELLEARTVSHFYYLPLGRGLLSGNQIRCRRCRTAVPVDAADYDAVSQDKKDDVLALVSTLGAKAMALVEQRGELEGRVLAGGLSPEERAALVEEPFLLLNPRLEIRAAETRFDRESGGALAATIGLPLLLMLAEERAPQSLSVLFGVAEIAIIVVGLAASFYLVATDQRRYYRKEIEPLLARTLAPLRPSREELERALKKLKQIGRIIAHRADIERLLAQAKVPARAKA